MTITCRSGLAESICSRNVLAMPEQIPPIRSHPFNAPRTLRHAAAEGMVIELRGDRRLLWRRCDDSSRWHWAKKFLA
jgi:hypothetical protein